MKVNKEKILYQTIVTQRENPSNRMIHQSGIHLVNGDGKTIKLVGVNLGSWLNWEGYILGGNLLQTDSNIKNGLVKLTGQTKTNEFTQNFYNTFITNDDLKAIKSLGFNTVRLPLNYRFLNDEKNWTILDTFIQNCRNNDLYVVLDLHSLPGGQSKYSTADPGKILVWNSDESKEKTIDIWKQLATHFKENTTIAGYDLINEPNFPDNNDLLDLYLKIIKEIRTVDKDHLIIIEGNKLGRDFSLFDKPLTDNQVYSFHLYSWFGDNREKLLSQYSDVAKKQNVPLWVGEFGENNYQIIQSTLDFFNREETISGWSYWTWKRATRRYSNLNIISVPEEWKRVINWIYMPYFHRKPTTEETDAAMTDFLNAVQYKNITMDKTLEQIFIKSNSSL